MSPARLGTYAVLLSGCAGIGASLTAGYMAYVRPLDAPPAPPQWQVPAMVEPAPQPQAMPAQPPAFVIAPVRTVDWFMQHAAERQDKVRACRASPGEAMHDPECPNAERAASHVALRRVINSIPD